MKRDGLTLGWGMAGCTWFAARFPAEATVQLRDDGTVRVACGTGYWDRPTRTSRKLQPKRPVFRSTRSKCDLGDTSFRPAYFGRLVGPVP